MQPHHQLPRNQHCQLYLKPIILTTKILVICQHRKDHWSISNQSNEREISVYHIIANHSVHDLQRIQVLREYNAVQLHETGTCHSGHELKVLTEATKGPNINKVHCHTWHHIQIVTDATFITHAFLDLHRYYRSTVGAPENPNRGY